MSGAARFGGFALCLAVLAGCAGGGDWTKHGADAAEIAREYQDCVDLAGTAVSKEADIDQDIAATRASDLQHSAIVETRAHDMQDTTRRRDDAIIASCMQQKGFVERR